MVATCPMHSTCSAPAAGLLIEAIDAITSATASRLMPRILVRPTVGEVLRLNMASLAPIGCCLGTRTMYQPPQFGDPHGSSSRAVQHAPAEPLSRPWAV